MDLSLVLFLYCVLFFFTYWICLSLLVPNEKWYTLETNPFLDNHGSKKLRVHYDVPNSSYAASGVYRTIPHIHENQQGAFEIVIIVKSYVLNIGQRIAIRNTWSVNNKHVKTYFVIGQKTNFTEIIDNEIKIYNDILQLTIEDTYHSLVYKTIYSIMWVVNVNSKYFHFADDDRFVNVNNILKYSKDELESTDVKIIGHKVTWSKVYRNYKSKHALTYKEYPYFFYPPYVIGGTLLTNYKTLCLIKYGLLSTKIIRTEDAYLGMVAYGLSIKVEHSSGFTSQPVRHSELHHILSSPGYELTYRLVEAWALIHKKKNVEYVIQIPD